MRFSSLHPQKYVAVLADVLCTEDAVYTGGKNGTSGDQRVIDDIHNALMSYIHDQPCTWAHVLSSVSDLLMETSLL